jgi:hypothetical protein
VEGARRGSQILDAEAEAVSEALQARRAAFATRRTVSLSRQVRVHTTATCRTTAKCRRSPDRQASLQRRRRQAMSGVVPAKIAASFTMAENAVLTVIARQCQRSGTCSLPIDMIAALAGVSRTVVKDAQREARKLGLIHVRERRIPGRKNLPNIVTIVSREWSAWLKLTIGVGFTTTTGSHLFNPASSRPASTAQRHGEGRKIGTVPASSGSQHPVVTAPF